MLRDGRAYPITWSRAHEGGPTQYLDADGEPMALDPGQVWVVLQGPHRKVQVSPPPMQGAAAGVRERARVERLRREPGPRPRCAACRAVRHRTIRVSLELRSDATGDARNVQERS